MLTNKDAYFSKEHEVYKEFIKEIKNALNTSDAVFADATHLTQASRTKLLRALGPALKDVEVNAIALKVPMDIAIARNNERDGLQRVPEGVIKSMYKDYTTPTIEEGFDNVWQAIYNGKDYGKGSVICRGKLYTADEWDKLRRDNEIAYNWEERVYIDTHGRIPADEVHFVYTRDQVMEEIDNILEDVKGFVYDVME
jgi:tRNA uridine 5-carbamoylmethylation protein Kti12